MDLTASWLLTMADDPAADRIDIRTDPNGALATNGSTTADLKAAAASKASSDTVLTRVPISSPLQPTFRWLYVVDAIGLFATMIAIALVRYGSDWPTYPMSHYMTGFSIATIIHMLVYYFGGLYDREHRLGSRQWLPKASGLTLIAVLLDSVVAFATDRYLMPRLNLVALLVIASLLLAFNRWLAHSLRVARFGQPRVLLVGNPDDISLAETHLADSDRDAIITGRASEEDDLLQAIEHTKATDVLLLSGGALDRIYPDPLEALEIRLIGVYHRLSPSDTLLGVPRSRQIAGMPFVALRSHALSASKVHFKRTLDVVYLTLLAPIVLVLVALISLYVRAVAGKGVFFRQERVGRYGHPFTIAKFRTMYHGAEEVTGPILAEADDVRVIRALRWLRNTRLDELPQFWNVLKGQMCIVGPRPERPELALQFEDLIPGYSRRHDIAPGVTGLAQVNGRYHTDPGYKLGHDLQYLVNWSPVLDVQIMLRTVWVILARRT